MALREIPLELSTGTPPERVTAFLSKARAHMDAFYGADWGRKLPKYVPSDPEIVYSALASLIASPWLRGDLFCEWGCGFGIATGLASMLGLEAIGIEIEDELVNRARALAEQTALKVTLIQGSYLPEGFESAAGMGGEDLVRPDFTEMAAEIGDISIEEIDLFFVYPWPDQEQLIKDLFETVASPGAILLMYFEEGEIAAFVHGTEDE